MFKNFFLLLAFAPLMGMLAKPLGVFVDCLWPAFSHRSKNNGTSRKIRQSRLGKRANAFLDYIEFEKWEMAVKKNLKEMSRSGYTRAFLAVVVCADFFTGEKATVTFVTALLILLCIIYSDISFGFFMFAFVGGLSILFAAEVAVFYLVSANSLHLFLPFVTNTAFLYFFLPYYFHEVRVTIFPESFSLTFLSARQGIAKAVPLIAAMTEIATSGIFKTILRK